MKKSLGRRGEFFPFNKWITALILLFTVYVAYGSMSNTIETLLPQAYQEQSFVNAQGTQAIDFTVDNFVLGILVLFAGVIFFLFLSGLPGQREDVVR